MGWGGRAASHPSNFPFHYGIIQMLVHVCWRLSTLWSGRQSDGVCVMWKEIGKALVVSVIIPVSVQLGTQLAEQYREKLAKKTKFTIKLT